MDDRTRRYYDLNAREISERYESIESPIKKYFALAFPKQARIADIGTGTGRDLSALVREGYQDSYGLEPVSSMREQAVARHPELGGRLFPGDLPDDMSALRQIGALVDGIVCSAVLQHLPRARLFDAIYALKEVLCQRGRVLTSIPVADMDLDRESRDEAGRLFNRITPEELELLFTRVGFVSIGRWNDDDALGRQGRRWATMLFELRSLGEHRPLDLIAAVLGQKERKVATYKLALIRALADIALTRPKSVVWRADGFVAVPVDEVAERWILYYWPLFESADFLPQMSGEWKSGAHTLRFEGELSRLIEIYARQGGLASFSVQRREGPLSGNRALAHAELMRKLRTAIREGPVTHAGGSLPARLFGMDGRYILVAAPLWQELSLMGSWIIDALMLRWANLVSELASGDVPPAVVLSVLMKEPDIGHETRVVRAILGSEPRLECVWTGSGLEDPLYEVDHVLPHALWHNNDLWNLMPTQSRINSEKRAKLPTRRLLGSRRSSFLRYWEIYRTHLPARFGAEARAQTGEADPTFTTLFHALVESVEVTALRWGCERWEP